MIGVTIGIGERYLAMASRAAASVRKHARIPTAILSHGLERIPKYHKDFGAQASSLRLHRFEWFDGDVFYCDADTMMLKPWDLGQFEGRTELVAVRDLVGTVRNDAARVSMPPGGILQRRHDDSE